MIVHVHAWYLPGSRSGFDWYREEGHAATVTSRRNPATRSRHIPASCRLAQVHLEGRC
jgi:hypothetical protein